MMYDLALTASFPNSYVFRSIVIHSSFVYEERCRQCGPYRMTKAGTGASIKHAAAKMVKPGPNPSLSVKGAVIKGKNVPAKQRVINTAVNAEAEYKLNASVTYVSMGTMMVMIENPIRTVNKSKNQNGQCSPAEYP